MTREIVFIGSIGCGKTALIRALRNTRYSGYKPTIGAEVSYIWKKSKKVALWEVSGDGRFRHIIDGYINRADLVVLCYDNTRESEEWALGMIEKVKCDVCVVKCKSEKISEIWELEHYCHSRGIKHFKASAFRGGVGGLKDFLITKEEVMVFHEKPKRLGLFSCCFSR